MSKEILVVLSEWGFWGEEVAGPLEVLDRHRNTATFITPNGLDDPLNHSALFPVRPCFNSENTGHNLEVRSTAPDKAGEGLKKLDARLLVGGSGPIVDESDLRRYGW